MSGPYGYQASYYPPQDNMGYGGPGDPYNREQDYDDNDEYRHRRHHHHHHRREEEAEEKDERRYQNEQRGLDFDDRRGFDRDYNQPPQLDRQAYNEPGPNWDNDGQRPNYERGYGDNQQQVGPAYGSGAYGEQGYDPRQGYDRPPAPGQGEYYPQQQQQNPYNNEYRENPYPNEPQPGAEGGDRGLMGAMGGAAVGGFAGHKAHHGFLGLVGGAIAGSMLEDFAKKQHHKKEDQAAYASSGAMGGPPPGQW